MLPKLNKSILKKVSNKLVNTYIQTSAYGAPSNIMTNHTTQQPTSSHISFAIANEYGVNETLNSASQSTIDYEMFGKGRAASVTHHADSAIELTRSISNTPGEVDNKNSYSTFKKVKLDLKHPQLNTDRFAQMLKSPSVEVVKSKHQVSATSRRMIQTKIQERSASTIMSGQKLNMYHTVR